MKFKTKSIKLGKNPIFIVGLCPGKQRRGSKTHIVWEGNRSGDFINTTVQNKSNIYLTNLFNYSLETKITRKILETGLKELRKDIETMLPCKIVCLGVVSYSEIKKMNLGIPLFKLEHPSYILRFNKNREKYINKLNEVLL